MPGITSKQVLFWLYTRWQSLHQSVHNTCQACDHITKGHTIGEKNLGGNAGVMKCICFPSVKGASLFCTYYIFINDIFHYLCNISVDLLHGHSVGFNQEVCVYYVVDWFVYAIDM